MLLAACSGGADQTHIGRPGAAADSDSEADPVVLEPVEQSAPEDVPSALEDVGPVAVTYCPLCNSALAYDRRVADRIVTWGSLYLSALVMYDRQTESLWSQIEGRAIAGLLAGTGHARDYRRAPTPGTTARTVSPSRSTRRRTGGRRRRSASWPSPAPGTPPRCRSRLWLTPGS